MRADIHDGPEQPLQSEAGYIDARPLCRQIDEILLRRTAGPYIGSDSALLTALCALVRAAGLPQLADFRSAPLFGSAEPSLG